MHLDVLKLASVPPRSVCSVLQRLAAAGQVVGSHGRRTCSQAPAPPLAQPGYLCPRLCVLSPASECGAHRSVLPAGLKQELHSHVILWVLGCFKASSTHFSSFLYSHHSLARENWSSLVYPSHAKIWEKISFLVSTVFKFNFFFSHLFLFFFPVTGTINQHVTSALLVPTLALWCCSTYPLLDPTFLKAKL